MGLVQPSIANSSITHERSGRSKSRGAKGSNDLVGFRAQGGAASKGTLSDDDELRGEVGGEEDLRERSTTAEGAMANKRDGGREVELDYAGTTVKGAMANGGKRDRKGEVGEGTLAKGVRADHGEAGGEADIDQGSARKKGHVGESVELGGKGYSHQGRAAAKGTTANAS